MTEVLDVQPQSQHELVLARILDAPRESVYRCWTEPTLFPQWFCPEPWTVSHAELDVRPGGQCNVTMRSPDGEEFPNPGIYLEVVPNEKLVFTDAYTRAWVPSEKPFMTAIVTFEEAPDGKTRYVARARHWSAGDRKAHEEMGFHEGWGKVAEQLEAVAKNLAAVA